MERQPQCHHKMDAKCAAVHLFLSVEGRLILLLPDVLYRHGVGPI